MMERRKRKTQCSLVTRLKTNDERALVGGLTIRTKIITFDMFVAY